MKKLVVSIINYRTAEMTLGCVRSVLDDIGDHDVAVVVVDNASDDGSVEALSTWIDAQARPVPVTLVASVANTGFSGGHNQAFRAVEAEFYLVLNSDGLLRPGFLSAILAAAAAHPAAGLIVPRIETAQGEVQTNCFRFPGLLSELDRGAASGPVTRLLHRRTVSLGPDPDPGAVEWASFACILLRRSMIDAIGPMDEGYFLYFEDAEYCLRARRAGWRLVRAPGALMVHFRGGSGPVKALEKARRRLPAYYYRSRSRFMAQAHGHSGLIAANLMWHLGRGMAQMRRLAGKPVPKSMDAEARDIWTGARSPLLPTRASGG
jgi:N-acetylglucosaminyl-diphospho-decaprenol L-rhamnosyltransferase